MQHSGIDASDLDRARDADLLTIAQALGTRLKRTGTTEFEGPCPVCGGTDRFSVNTHKKIWNCRGCGKGGDPIDLAMHVLSLDFRQAVAWLTGEGKRSARIRVAPSPPPPTAPELEFQERRTRALVKACIREIVPVRGSPGERFLHVERKIDTEAISDVLERTNALGWHPSVYFNEPEYPKRGDPPHPLHGQRLGAIIGIMSDSVTGKPTDAISRTYIHDGKKVIRAKTLGSPVGIIRLPEDADVLHGLHIAEGIETALDAMARDWRQIWSTGSKSLMAKFPILSGVEALTIFADNDENGGGLHAAAEAAQRWLAAGREVHVFQRATSGDLNDAYREVRR
jgi:Toprim domain/CHC2 zinc finger